MLYRVVFHPANRAYRRFFLEQTGRLTRYQEKCAVFTSVKRAREAARQAVPATYNYQVEISPL